MAMRILHVEDNAADADLTRRALADQAGDIRLEHVSTLAGAIEQLRDSDRFELALVDLSLPDGSGLELLAHIRERRLPLAVVILTGSGDQESAVAALKAGADDYVTKHGDYLSGLYAMLVDTLARVQASSRRRNLPLRVLYAEHNAFDIDLTRRHLGHHAPHIRLTIVHTADEVLACLPADGQKSSDWDILLLDYQLPGTDAMELAKRLHYQRGLDLPVVIVTGQGSEEVAAQAMRIGIADYLIKHPGYLYELPPILEKVRHQAELARERAVLLEREARLRLQGAALEAAATPMVITDRNAVIQWANPAFSRLTGYSLKEAIGQKTGELIRSGMQNQTFYENMWQAILSGKVWRGELINQKKDGSLYHEDMTITPVLASDGQVENFIAIKQDITERKLAQQVQQLRTDVLDRITATAPLPAILEDIAHRLESLRPGIRVSIQLLDETSGCLLTGAAPSLPDFFNAAMDGLKPKIGQASCGTSAALGEAMIVEDILAHPYWAPYASVAAQAGLRACWSIPFKDENGQILGTFGIYYGQTQAPNQIDMDLIGEFARITGLAVQRVRASIALRQAAAVFQSTREGILITDLDSRITSINPAFTQITGYEEADVLGRNPKLLQSGRHDKAYFLSMWASIQQTGHWQGEIWNRRKDGEPYPQLLTISTVRDDRGLPTHYAGVMTDISQLKRSEARLEHLAHYDPLTNLPNRLLLLSRMQHALEQAERQQRQVAVLFIDLDRFKDVNDSLGHPIGDKLLEILAQRMRKRLRENDTLGRLGGDEFLVVLEGLERPEDAAGVAQNLIQELEQPFTLPRGHEVYIGASIGISVYPGDGQDANALIQHADVAMYQAKEQGRNTYRFYTTALTSAANERLDLGSRLRRALVQEEFVLHYQPQFDIQTGTITGCEALLRWHAPEEGMIAPDRFIPLAEETGLIVPLGEWVLKTACVQAKAWQDAGLPPLVMAVNLSGRQLQEREVVRRVATILEETGLPPEFLKLELTESAIMGHAEQAETLLHKFKALNLRLSIDDFGTGYSSLAYLKRFPIDELKIDRGFVRDIPQDLNDVEIAAAIIALARNLNLKVVAEGVETQEQLDFLSRQGCHTYQGYLSGRPVPADEFIRLLALQTQKPA
jgi:diguanylate cyclase (GGDEF)-like protein/PAS domain S-box-containing protein